MTRKKKVKLRPPRRKGDEKPVAAANSYRKKCTAQNPPACFEVSTGTTIVTQRHQHEKRSRFFFAIVNEHIKGEVALTDAELKEAVRPEVEKQLRERSYPLLMGRQDHDRCASYHGFGRSWLTYWTITAECSAAYEQITVMNMEAVQFSILNFQCFPLHFPL